MIVTKPRDWTRIRENLDSVGAKRVYLVGCGECATQSETGGERQVLDTKARLEMAGYEVVGWTVGQVTCNLNATKLDMRKSQGSPDNADAVLVLACGAGVQTVADAVRVPTFPGLESAFLGTVVRHGVFEERCSMCGDCVLDRTAGICPVTTCPKGLLNGPCGAMWDRRCDVTGDRDCVFVLIHERLAEQGRVPSAEPIPPKDFGAHRKPGRIDVRDEGEATEGGDAS